MEFKHRIAKLDDIPRIEGLMHQSITKLLGYYVDEEELEASFESMGLDDQLIKDKTYFLIFHGEILVGVTGTGTNNAYTHYRFSNKSNHTNLWNYFICKRLTIHHR